MGALIVLGGKEPEVPVRMRGGLGRKKLADSFVTSRVANVFLQSSSTNFPPCFTWSAPTTPERVRKPFVGQAEGPRTLACTPPHSEKRGQVSVMEGSGLSLPLRTDSHREPEPRSDGRVQQHCRTSSTSCIINLHSPRAAAAAAAVYWAQQWT